MTNKGAVFVFLAIIATGLFGFLCGLWNGRAEIRQEAVDNRIAHWAVESQESPRVVFVWGYPAKYIVAQSEAK